MNWSISAPQLNLPALRSTSSSLTQNHNGSSTGIFCTVCRQYGRCSPAIELAGAEIDQFIRLSFEDNRFRCWGREWVYNRCWGRKRVNYRAWVEYRFRGRERFYDWGWRRWWDERGDERFWGKFWFLWHVRDERGLLDDADARLSDSASSSATSGSLDGSWSSVWHVSAWVV